MNDNIAVILVVAGAVSAGYAVAALFFLRFWRQSGDRLFLFFSAAFALLMIQRLALAWSVYTGHDTLWIYVLRLVAFLVILLAIADKNRRP